MLLRLAAATAGMAAADAAPAGLAKLGRPLGRSWEAQSLERAWEALQRPGRLRGALEGGCRVGAPLGNCSSLLVP